MALSKKHFIAIATKISLQREAVVAVWGPRASGNTTSNVAHSVLESLARDMCADFAAENPNFDSHRFLTACGF